jgi:putative ABC transport system permease protein
MASDGHTFYTELSRRLAAIPGVLSLGFGTDIPFENRSGRLISPEHENLHGNPIVYNTDVAGAYFQSLCLRLLKGRFLTDHDNKDSEPVAIVNESFGKAFWSTGDSLDRRFKFGPPQAPGPWIRIVGVTVDSGARTPDKPSEPRIYVPLDQDFYKEVAFRDTWFVLRTQGDALALGPSIQAAVRSLDPSMPVVKLRSMEQVVSNAVAPRSANTWLVTVFSVAALLLSLLGIYGVVAHSVSQRRREIGIRMALGASRREISSIVLWEGGRLVIVALAIGIPVSFAASGILRSLLFGVPSDDSITRVLVVAAIIISVSASLLVPLWRAIHVDPQIALRDS